MVPPYFFGLLIFLFFEKGRRIFSHLCCQEKVRIRLVLVFKSLNPGGIFQQNRGEKNAATKNDRKHSGLKRRHGGF